jgi:hypothetical protein
MRHSLMVKPINRSRGRRVDISFPVRQGSSALLVPSRKRVANQRTPAAYCNRRSLLPPAAILLNLLTALWPFADDQPRLVVHSFMFSFMIDNGDTTGEGHDLGQTGVGWRVKILNGPTPASLDIQCSCNREQSLVCGAPQRPGHLFFDIADYYLDSPICLPAFGGVIGGHGPYLAKAAHGNNRVRRQGSAHKIIVHRLGAIF